MPSDGPELCTSSADCSTAGEMCAPPPYTACFSEESVIASGFPLVNGGSSGDDVDTSTTGDTESDDGSGDGVTGAICSSSSECADGRICINADRETCSAGEACICVPSDGPEPCTSSADCSTAGEVCVQVSEGRVCYSEENATALGFPIVDDGSSCSDGDTSNIQSGGNDNDDEVCIDARALGHVSTNGLVFEKHAVSRVLCDENNSCATRGHMVVFRGHAMRMSTYCDSVGCIEAVIEVNSPRFYRGMRIASNTKGLEYTVFAARYDTQAEESLIRMAVRLGL